MRKFLIIVCLLLLLLPAANAQDVTTSSGVPVDVILAAPEGATEPLTFIVDALPVNGTLTGQAPQFAYQPDPGFSGTDTILYTIVDGAGAVTSGTMVIQVTSDGTTSAPAVPGTPEPVTTVEVDPETGAAFTLVIGESYEILAAPENGTLSGQVPDVIYTPDERFIGEDVFSYSVVVAGEVQTYDVTLVVGRGNQPRVIEPKALIPVGVVGLSSQLAELAMPSGNTDLRAQAATFVQGDLVEVIIAVRGETGPVAGLVQSTGGTVITELPGYVIANVPVGSLVSLAADANTTYLRLPQRYGPAGNVVADRSSTSLQPQSASLSPMTGSVVSEAVAYSNASAWHTEGFNGTGVKIGVIDYGFDSPAPAETTCLAGVAMFNGTAYTNQGASDGNAVIETICDMAPNAQVYARHVATETQYVTALQQLAGTVQVDIIAGALLPVDGSGNTPAGRGDGVETVSSAVDTVSVNYGVLVITPSGETHRQHYEGRLDVIETDINGGDATEFFHSFDGEISGWGTDVYNNITSTDPFETELVLGPGSPPVTFILSWSDWDGTVETDLDLRLYKYDEVTENWGYTFASATSNTSSGVPIESMSIPSGSLPQGRYRLAVVIYTEDSEATANDLGNNEWIQLTELGNNVLSFQDIYPYSSIIAPATSQSSFTVGAFYQSGPSTRELETFSGRGPSNGAGGGNPFGEPPGFFQPQIVAHNGTSVSLGGAYAGGFNGTRASAAHTAGAAALILDAFPTYDRFNIANFLRLRSSSLGDPGQAGADPAYGHGYLYLGPPNDDNICTSDTPGIYRSADRKWYLRNSNSQGFANAGVFLYGNPSDKSIVGDWNGDGIDTVGIYRNGTFYLRNSNTQGTANIVFNFGNSSFIPVAGDWDGDGVDTVGLYQPSQGKWLLKNSNSAGPPDLVFLYGLTNETPVTGDWDGDGVDTIGVFRASDRRWYMRNSNSQGFSNLNFVYGFPATDIPVPGDWNGDCIDTVGIYRKSEARWYLRNTNQALNAQIVFRYGLANETPVVGDWDNATAP